MAVGASSEVGDEVRRSEVVARVGQQGRNFSGIRANPLRENIKTVFWDYQ